MLQNICILKKISRGFATSGNKCQRIKSEVSERKS